VETWYLLESPPASAAMNMAVDEALLRHAAERAHPLLRLYSWEQPAVSFGYFQRFPTHLTGPYVIVRRPTGGGIVYHVRDTTYTVVVPPGHALYTMSTGEAYRVLHQAVAGALAFNSKIAGEEIVAPRGQYECFQNPVQGDVVADGEKLAGGAQRRGKWGMLHQGSIATQVAGMQLQEAFRRTFGIAFQPYALSTAEHELAGQLAAEKYATAAWNHRL
jgi:lipoyl(octanoyl) transferase